MPIEPPLTPAPALARPRLLEVGHVAHRLSMGEEYVRQLLRAKQLPAIRPGGRWRVDPIDLQAFIEAHRVAPLSISTDKFCCPHCDGWKSKVVDSRPDTEGVRYLRWRQCTRCGQLFETAEEVVTGRRPSPGTTRHHVRDRAAVGDG